jgi:hypothetical protein
MRTGSGAMFRHQTDFSHSQRNGYVDSMDLIGPIPPHHLGKKLPPSALDLNYITNNGHWAIKTIFVLAKLALGYDFARFERDAFDPIGHTWEHRLAFSMPQEGPLSVSCLGSKHFSLSDYYYVRAPAIPMEADRRDR